MTTRRGIILGTAGYLLAGCAKAAGQAPEIVGQGLRLKTSDYATDRAAFRTKLLVKGPSPQRDIMPKPPVDVQAIDYASGSLTLKAWVGRPAATATKLPVVTFLHGGFGFGEEDFDMARPFLDAGYAIVTPILRGENGQAGNFSMFYDEVDDVLAVADHVRTLSWADPDHIYLAGHSVGGTHTMLACQASPRFRAVAAFSGSPDQIAFTRGKPWSQIVPFDTADKAEFELRSPLAYARSFKSPARLFYGSEEAFFATSIPATAALARQAGLDVEAVVVPGDHFGAVPKEIELAIAFFRAHA